jgi:hypothetical protein
MSREDRRWELRQEYISGVGAQIRPAVLAWVAGYVQALEDLKSDLETARGDGVETLDGALEEVEVNLAAAGKVQAITEGWS